jgi:NAD(P)-dependent dehydrogenase (short-subunit alcohol dehydrogenase family)
VISSTLLADRTAVVTGASSGLGRHFAQVLAGAGATVVAVARRADLLDRLADEVGGIVPVPADVTTEEGRERAIEAAVASKGTFSVLVNNAGGGAATAALETTVSEFEDTLALNLVATFGLCQLAARAMVPTGGGSIVNIASMFGLVASSPVDQAAYCAAKSGVVGLTRQLGCEWARDGIRVNALAPGWFDSDLTTSFTASEQGARFVRRGTPMGRTGRLDELDGPLLLLASDLGGFMTGHTIPVDGGWTAR